MSIAFNVNFCTGDARNDNVLTEVTVFAQKNGLELSGEWSDEECAQWVGVARKYKQDKQIDAAESDQGVLYDWFFARSDVKWFMVDELMEDDIEED